MEKKLWEASTNKLIIEPENIEESYWRSQERILRDNGQGRKLDDYEKELLTKEIQDNQRKSLNKWANYLGDEQAPYPTWFKVYAWDGISKMGTFSKDKKVFNKRNEHSVAPYPHLNPGVLGKVYGAINDFYHTHRKNQNPEEEQDKKLQLLVQSGNFNKLYSKFLLEQKSILKTPEHTKDIHGKWVEYSIGDEEKLANAADGTPWCIADPSVGANYLRNNSYGNFSNYDDNETDNSDNQAKFILFHLQDQETGQLSATACASIRLDTQGNVAEISGLNDGQALEDSLVPIVEEKVKTLPGGEDFLKAFADKQRLIQLDHKMQAGGDLTKDDVNFIFGDIKTLDTYSDEDPRIPELKEYFFNTIETNKTLNELSQVEKDQIVNHLPEDGIAEYFAQLLELGVNPEKLVESVPNHTVSNQFDQLLELGVNPEKLVDHLPDYEVEERFDQLLELGVRPEKLIQNMTNYAVNKKIDQLLELNVNPEDLAIALHGFAGGHVDKLLELGVNPNKLAEIIGFGGIDENFNRLLELGVNLDTLTKEMDFETTNENFDQLLKLGADLNNLTKQLTAYDIKTRFDQLVGLGADPDILASAISVMSRDEIKDRFDQLVQLGANPEIIFDKMNYDERGEYLDKFLSLGVDPEKIVKGIYDDDAWDHFSQFVELGVKPETFLQKMTEDNINQQFDKLLEIGLSNDAIRQYITPHQAQELYDELLDLGLSYDELDEIIWGPDQY